MNAAEFPVLSILIWLPLLGAIIVGCIRNLKAAKWGALAIAGLELVTALLAVIWFQSENSNELQWVEHHAWIDRLNIEYFLGVDGVSILLLPLSALLTLLTLLATWNSVQRLPHFHLSLLLALEGITMGVFTAMDMMLFFLFWELTLPPIFFLIGLWGIGPGRRAAAMKYTLVMLFGGVALLFAIILLAFNHVDAIHGTIPDDLAFSLPVLLTTPLSAHLETAVFFLLMVGFAVKAPLPPFHTWLPTVAMEGSTQMTSLLTGLKLGVYGIIRFGMPLAPTSTVEYNWTLGIIGAVTLIYGALVALQQSNFRRLLAYASISHIGLIIVGLSSLNMQGIQGALFQLVNFSVDASALMLIAGFIHHRLGSTERIHMGGLAKVMPRLTGFYFLFMLAGLGIPGTNGFPAELLLVVSALTSHPSLAIAALAGAVLSAAYMLSFTRRAFMGPTASAAVRQLQELRPRELSILCVFGALVISFGLWPDVILEKQRAAAEAWLNHLLEPPAMDGTDFDSNLPNPETRE
ncbi:complex I subunit 4 family protein [Methylomicrobium sp. RS1]|jgi:NADH-quinone oxidoreductase subunit M|uniref:complex I subunit 4 family protein n=1 Tax=Candidatus Methylomicrobium oryzae TaxID=2802053 RepID=UPI0019244B2D|nr:NADH-quinone oxidoreductase subunit M [Methylomicrobium sp. RS1]MBL1265405.1 NADH-quinone oxidoreductase subunit M [Methylomicrobium sp. RS1]